MKKIYIIILLISCLTKSIDSLATKKVNEKDFLALVDLYRSKDGLHWINHPNWLTKKPVKTWYGILLTTNTFLETRVRQINLQFNNLRVIIPNSIGDLSELIDLNLNDNQLSGTIPASIDSLKNLDYLYLNNNQLSGTLPIHWSNLNLFGFNLSNNQLTGAFLLLLIV